jgi:hypothetical protein
MGASHDLKWPLRNPGSGGLFDDPAVFPNDDRESQHAMLRPELARRAAMGAESDLPVLGKF